ncbi:MAG: MarR family transcriptional regulator [Chloroflexia bacterium]|nr:MarR family transcriptional regulator [Chloroflexia bacterium]MDQ3523986.1 MarR family transcriptional regulator [Chloroflexota bacterium]
MSDTTTSSPTTQRRQELPLPVRTWVRLMRVFHRIDRQSSDRFRDLSLSVGRFDVVNHAGLHEGATQQELADALLVTKGNICQLLDSLERDGLLRRQKEGRANRVYLTSTGREIRERAMERHISEISRSMSALDDDEQQTLLTLLRKLERGLDAV